MPWMEEAVRVEAGSVSHASSHGFASPNRPVSNATVAAIRPPNPSTSGHSLERSKVDKMKGSSGTSGDDMRVTNGSLIKKKVKRKPEQELAEAHSRLEEH